jgi:hypothetical protein
MEVWMNQNQSTTLGQIGALLGPAIVITILYGYIPQDLPALRTVLSIIQFGCMIGIAAIAVRSVIRDL